MSPPKPPAEILETRMGSPERPLGRRARDRARGDRVAGRQTRLGVLHRQDHARPDGREGARERAAGGQRLGVHARGAPPEGPALGLAAVVDVAFGGAVAPTLAFVTKETKLSKDERAALRALLDGMEGDDE